MASVNSSPIPPKQQATKNEPDPFVRKHPTFPPALVFLTYPLTLLAIALIVLAVGWMTGMFDPAPTDPT